jgi:LCP family protein required for cell wall assembly
VWRGLLAGLVIALSTAGAVYASVQLFADEWLPEPLPDFPRLEPPADGAPQTVMLIGSDVRVDDTAPPRSDTIMLVRLDPEAKQTRVMSLPRDLLVDGTKLNEAYARDGARGTVEAVRKLLSTPDHPFKIHHVITADFGGFREAIDEVGCVYVDVDREYFNDRGGPGGYAVIDIDPGYQKLCGKDALAYVRYRHGDNDVVRGTRQQEFLRQLRRQDGVEALMSYELSNLRRVGRLAKRTLRVDPGLREQEQLFRFAEAVMYSARHPVLNVPIAVKEAPGDPNSLVASREALRRSTATFLGTLRRPAHRASRAPRPAASARRPRSSTRAPRARTARSSPRGGSTSRSTSPRA